MKIISWNVNGIRAIIKKTFIESLSDINPDMVCLQETKAQDEQVAEALEALTGYHCYSNSAVKKGYAGTAILSKVKPLSVTFDMGIEEHDQEGRIVCAEFEKYYVISVYVPNSGSELKRLAYRQQWDADFCTYLKQLEQLKPVIVCGDFNVAHKDIDIARPKANYNKSAGFMQEEIDGMNRFIQSALVDSFRLMHPDQKECYSWWSYRAGAKANNIGWRIDYVLISDLLKNQVREAFILPEHSGSDHCPVGIVID